ncbi:MAG: acylglycerol kinase family protein [Ruminococcus sp.]|nr:acylglycerol kinase family protein [Ruminococcus sp.]
MKSKKIRGIIRITKVKWGVRLMHFDIVVNPAGASGKAWTLWEEIKPLFDDADCEYTLYKSTLTEGIESICSKVTKGKKGVRLVVIGGDGTLNEAERNIRSFRDYVRIHSVRYRK